MLRLELRPISLARNTGHGALCGHVDPFMKVLFMLQLYGWTSVESSGAGCLGKQDALSVNRAIFTEGGSE